MTLEDEVENVVFSTRRELQEHIPNDGSPEAFTGEIAAWCNALLAGLKALARHIEALEQGH